MLRAAIKILSSNKTNYPLLNIKPSLFLLPLRPSFTGNAARWRKPLVEKAYRRYPAGSRSASTLKKIFEKEASQPNWQKIYYFTHGEIS
jgi:hypothetical protein